MDPLVIQAWPFFFGAGVVSVALTFLIGKSLSHLSTPAHLVVAVMITIVIYATIAVIGVNSGMVGAG